MQKFMKKSLPAALAAGSLLGLGVASQEVAADGILFPYLSTQSGVLSFVTIVNDGQGKFSSISFYNFTYGYKAAPPNLVERGSCTHADSPVFTTPADMMTFEIGARVGLGQPMFETAGDTLGFPPAGKLTSTSFPLTAANAIAFLSVEAAPSNNGAAVASDEARLFGWAEVIDPAANMTHAYSTHNFLDNAAFGAADYTGLSGTSAALSWYTTAAVDTQWHVLDISGTIGAIVPAAGGGRRFTVLATARAGVAAFDRDENPFSGIKNKPIRCFAIIKRSDIMSASTETNTNNGGWTYLVPGTTTNAADDGVENSFAPASNTLVHKIQTAIPAATGLGARSAINREPTGGQSFAYAP